MRSYLRIALVVTLLLSLRAAPALAQGTGLSAARRPGRKNVLAWIDPRSNMQSHGAATIERLGYESGLYDTFIRTDSQSFTDLKNFDAIFFLGSNETDLPAERRADLLSFVQEDGKGFIAVHAANDAFRSWTEFGEMLGGRLVGHPWGFTDETLVIEDPHFPGMQELPRILSLYGETYEVKEMSREKVDVLIRLDVSKLDATKPDRKDGDFPQAWAKTYGKGRVYYNSIGHDITIWDTPAIQQMYFEAMKWVLGLTDAKVEPHPLARMNGSPQPLK